MRFIIYVAKFIEVRSMLWFQDQVFYRRNTRLYSLFSLFFWDSHFRAALKDEA